MCQGSPLLKLALWPPLRHAPSELGHDENPEQRLASGAQHLHVELYLEKVGIITVRNTSRTTIKLFNLRHAA